MTDKQFLLWLADRLVVQYGESPDVDYVHKLCSIAEALPEEQVTPNTSEWVYSVMQERWDRGGNCLDPKSSHCLPAKPIPKC